MSIGIAGFDHPVIAVRDMEASRNLYEKLGFTVPPRGSHIEWGTGNWCIMLRKNYLELRGITDAARYTHGLEKFLATREGQMGMAFRSDLDNRDLYKHAVAAGLHPAEPRELTRNFELGTGNVPVSFRLMFFDPVEAPALMASLVCQHLTPERLRKPEYLVHANTALDVFEMTSVTDSLEGIDRELAPLFGEASVVRSADEVCVNLPDGGIVRIVTASIANKEGISLEGVELPYLTSIGIQVKDLHATQETLQVNGVPYVRIRDRIRVTPEYACGTYLDFAEV
ncbi:VOC family protein [Burkholderia sp. MR1-5-21]